MQPAYCIFIKPCYTYLSIVLHNVKKESEGNTYMKKRILSMLLALVMLATLLPLGLIDTAEAATGAQILTPTSGTSGTGANGGTWKCSSAGDTLTLTDYDGYPIETDATTIRFSGTNTITVPLSNLSGALRVYGLKLTSTKDIWMRGEDGSSLNIVFKPGSGTEDVDVSGIDADGPLLIDTAGDITISAPYGYPYGIRARQGLDYSGPGALDITVRGSYFWKSNHWCAAYGIAAEKGAISLSGSGSKTIRVQSGANTQQISSTPYAIYHEGGTGSSGTATISVDTGALHIEMNGDGCGIYNMGSADSAYVNINNVPELSIEKADSAIETAYSGTVNVRNSKLRIANGRYAIRNSGGTINMENADVTAAVRGSSVGYTDAAVHTGTLQVKGSSTVDMTATYGTVVYARAVSVNLSNGSFTAKTGQSKWPPIDAPVTLGVKTRLMTGVCSDADTGKYAGEKVDDLYVTSFASVESGTCGENVKWTLTRDGTLTISGTGTMVDYPYSTSAPWRSFRSQVKTVVIENGVTSIGNNAFYNCSSLTSVTIPNSVTSIRNRAFSGCTSLTSVTIPNGLTSIGDWTFSGCSSLTSVTIPNGVTSIGECAFYDCSSLTSVTIPSSVTSIGYRAFEGCSALTDMYYDGYGIDWLAVNGHGQIPDSATFHFKDNLYGKGTCGENVNWNLTRDGTLTISGTGAMVDYPYTTSAPWNSSRSQVKTVVIENGVTSIGNNAFYDCSSLTSVTIPNSVTSIRNHAFSGCTSLTSVTIPNGVTSIGDWTFSGCSSLASVTIPNSVTSIGDWPFYGCSSLTNVYYDGYGIDWMAVDGHGEIPDSAAVHFKDNLYDSGTCGENVNWNLTADGILTISGNGCVSDYTAVYDKNTSEFVTDAPWQAAKLYIKAVVIENGVTGIGEHAFYACRELERVTIPDTVTSIGDYAFCFCQELTGVTIPNSVTSLGSYIFNGCNNLAAVTISANVTNIRDCAFRYCNALTTLTIPEGVTTIGWEAFSGCSSLTGVTIPNSVTSIGSSAFDGCDALTDIYYGGYGIDWLATAGHNDVPNGTTVHFKDNLYGKGECGENVNWTLDASGTLTISGTGAMYDYDYIGERNPAPWCADGLNNRVRTVVVEKGITELGYDVFAACGELQKVTLPNGLTRIGSCAFIDCYSLPELTIPATVTTIESNAFTNCNSIKTLTLPGGLKEIGDAACSQMESLSSVTLGKGITRLSPYMFNMCYALTSVTVPEGVTGIGSCAFRDCENLQTLRLPASLKTVGETASSGTSIADVYFAGTAAQWNALRMEPGNNHIRCAKVHYRNAAAVPAAPKIKLTTSGNQFQLSWDAVPGAASYQVYRIVDFTVEDYTLLGTTKSTTFTDKTAKTGTTYTFAVKAVNANGESMTSSSCAGKLSSRPANVTLVSAKAVSGGIQVTWKEAAGAATYKVYRKDATNTSWTALTTTATGTSYVDKTAEPGVTYTYTVRGVASDGKTLSPSHDKTGVSATISSRPANVTLVSAKAVSGGIQVTWKEAAGAATYKVYRKDAANTSWTALTTTATGTSYVDKTAEPGVTYTYTVRGVASDGKTLSPSHDKTGVSATISSRPANVTLVSAKAVSGGIQVTWKEAAGAATYKVYRKDAANPDWTGLTTTATGTSYVDKTAVAGVTYTYTVRGVASDGKTLSPSHDKTGVSATMPKPVSRPANVTLVSAKAVSGGIQVTWKEAAGAATYKVYRKDAANTSWTALTTTATGTSYVDKTAKAGVTYTYTVRGVAKDGKTLSPSHDKTGVSATMPKPATRPANVTLVSAKAVSGGIQVTWKEAAGAATYKVYRKDATNTSWTALTTTATGTSYVDKTAVAGVTYTYTVRGVASDGKTLSPSHDKTGVSAVIAPAKVTLIRAEADSAGILVTWQKAAGAHSYQVYRKTAGTGWKCVAKNIHDTEWKDIDAAKGTKYIYTVRAVADDGTTRGGYDGTGKTATVTKDPTTPANVTLGKAVAGKGSITVTWSYAADARTYRVYRKAAGETKWTIMDKNATGKSWTDTNVTKGTTYTYTVRGVNANGKLSPSHDKTGVSAVAK